MLVYIATLAFCGIVLFNLFQGGMANVSLFTWHPFFACLFIASGTHAVHAVQASKNPRNSVSMHRLFHFIALAAATGAFGVIYVNKNNYNKPHFMTWHAWLGVATVSMYPMVMTVASMMYMYPALFGGEKFVRRVVYKMHRAGGYLTLLLAWTTATFGLNTMQWISPMAIYALAGSVFVTLVWGIKWRRLVG